MNTLAKLRRALQAALNADLDHTGSEDGGYLGAKDLMPLAAAVGELNPVRTEWYVEVRYPHWEHPEIWPNNEISARRQVRLHRARGATARLFRQEVYAGCREEVEP